jgi:UDP-N-acetylglucosamine diphosphorylase / glucose-1-phosphate thymidylyltransferase / UDP-N-acetylgalactosamine diphosphorylase / glucosamine-1-phosphate N-acetyltransferase / galactosamine-1-phosphate N-acetyltransferase
VARDETGLDYNDPDSGPLLLINSRANPMRWNTKWSELPPGSAVLEGEQLVAASMRKETLTRHVSEDGVLARDEISRLVKGSERLTAEGDSVLFNYPWDVLEANAGAIVAEGNGARKKKVVVSPRAEVEEPVVFDTRDGPVIVEGKARLEAFSRISGPCYISSEVIVHSALIRAGTTIGLGCKVGGEVASSIVYRRSNKAHLGYLGHSIVGEWVNIGAGAVTSDLKNTYGNVRAMRGSKKIDTGLVKLGCMIGDLAKISIGSMIYGGKSLGVASRCSGIVDSDIPSFTNYDGKSSTATRLGLDPILVSQARMKARRGESLASAEKQMLTYVYDKKAE